MNDPKNEHRKSSPQFEYRAHGNIALHRFKALYFFIPKVACSSLKIVCSRLLNMEPPDPENPLRYPHKRHFPYVKRSEILNEYRHYFKFAFVRNPWDRIVSCFNNKIHKSPDYNDQWYKNGVADNFWRYGDRFWGGMSFKDFVYTVASIPDQEAEEHIRPQSLFLTDKEGNRLVDFMGKFENLQDDLTFISTKLHFPPFDLPHLLKTRHGHYKDYYTEETKKVIATRYDRDIEMLEYEF